MGHETVLRWLRKDNAMPDSFRFANGEKILLDKKVLESMTKAVPVDEARIAALFTSLEKLRVLVWSQRAELMVMLLPSKEEIFAPGVAPDRASVIARVRQRLQEINMPVLDLYPVLRERGATQSPYFSRDIHLNAYGNRSVAEQFVAWFNSHRAVQKY
jgi:SGNH hydrolase-like domain, acetyltransferase AlgX